MMWWEWLLKEDLLTVNFIKMYCDYCFTSFTQIYKQNIISGKQAKKKSEFQP